MSHSRPLPVGFDLLDLHRLDPTRYPVLLESSAAGAHGRWDMLLAHAGEGFALHRDGVVRTLDGETVEGDFLDVLDALAGGAQPAQWRWVRVAVPRRLGAAAGLRTGAADRAGAAAAAVAGRAAGGRRPALSCGGAARPRGRRMHRRRRRRGRGLAGAHRRRCRTCRRIAAAAGLAGACARRRGRAATLPRRRGARARLPGRRRRVPGQPVARLAGALRRAAGTGGAVPAPARQQSGAVRRHLPHADGQRGQRLAGAAGVDPRRPGRDPPHRRHPSAPARRRRRRPHPRADRPRQGARRARDAGRPRAQRPRPRVHGRQRARGRADDGGELRPRPPHRQQRARRAARGRDAGPGDRRGVPGRHHHRRAEGALHGDHRRAGGRRPRRLHRRDGLARPQRRHGPEHPDPQCRGRGRRTALPHRRRHRDRLRSAARTGRNQAKARGMLRALGLE